MKAPNQPIPQASAVLDDTSTQYADIYVRADFTDTGIVPRPMAGLSASPDIIPQGSSALADPTTLISDANWNTDLGQDVTASQPNYIYMRGQNLAAASRAGQMWLYWSQASLLMWPYYPTDPTRGWATQNMVTAGGNQSSPISGDAGARVVTTDPFYWNPELPPNGDHYCLVGRVVTPEDSNPIPQDIFTTEQFSQYIGSQVNVCWRNVVTVPANTPAVVTVKVHYAQGALEGDIIFQLACTNIPVGAIISFTCGAPGPKPLIQMGATTVSNAAQASGIVCKVPANFVGDIYYTYDPNGTVPTGPIELVMQALNVVPPVSAVYNLSSPMEEMAIARELIDYIQTRYQHLADLGPTNVFLMGSHKMQTPDAPGLSAVAQHEATLAPEPTPPPTPAASFLQADGVTWLQGVGYPFSNAPGAQQSLRVATTPNSPIQAQTISFQQAPAAPAPASLATSLAFGSVGGDATLTLTFQNVAVGCDVSLDGGTAQFPIVLPRTSITKPDFSVSLPVPHVPAGVWPLQVKFWKNGLPLPAQATMTVSSTQTPAETQAQAAEKTPGFTHSVIVQLSA